MKHDSHHSSVGQPDQRFVLDSPGTRRRPALSINADVAWAWGYLLAVAVAELLTTFAHPILGSLVHAATLAGLLWQLVRAGARRHNLLVALLVPPLIRLLSLSLPLAGFPRVWWYFITSVPLFAATVMAAGPGGGRRSDLALYFSWRGIPIQAAVALGGLGLGWVEYQILHPPPLAPALRPGLIWLPALILLVCTGFLEELLFRGLLQHVGVQLLGLYPGLIYVSLLFAVLHIGYHSWQDVLFVFAAGLCFAWVVARTHSLWGVTLAHGLTNVSLFLIFPFL